MDMCFLKRFLFILFLFVSTFMLESQAAFANYSTHDYEKTNNQWLVGIGGGGATRSLPSSTKISNGTPVSAPYNHDIFSINTSDRGGIFTLFGGYQWNRLTCLLPYYNLSLHYEHQLDASITGKVQQYALPQFTNYHYSMSLNSDILSIIGKVGIIKYKLLTPYLSVGIGTAFNHLNSYDELPIGSVFPARINPGYGRHSNTNFAYTIGAGVDIFCDRNIWISLGYEYWNLGKVHSGSGAGSWSSTQLNFGTLESNTLLATVTYLFE